MLSNPSIRWPALASFSRSMGQMLEAGVEIRKSLTTSAKQSSDSRLPPAVERIKSSIASGASLADAFAREGELFPALFRDLVSVGEQTGSAPEVFASLAKYYESRVRQVREFRSAIAWPVIQLCAAIGILGLLIFILGLLPPMPDGRPFDVVGLGLYGTSGAMTWFGGWIALAIGGLVAWKFVANNVSGQMLLHPTLMQIPVLGKCMRAFAVSRFSWCFALTQQAGMSIRPSLECSLKATANGAFIAANPIIWDAVAKGETLTEALTESKLFPEDFLQFVDTAEQTGTVPEQLDRMSHLFEDEAQRAMLRLTRFFSSAVWTCVTLIIVFFILRIAMLYIGMINSAVNQIQ
jgi:type IV pilus assembly protein PilC